MYPIFEIFSPNFSNKFSKSLFVILVKLLNKAILSLRISFTIWTLLLRSFSSSLLFLQNYYRPHYGSSRSKKDFHWSHFLISFNEVRVNRSTHAPFMHASASTDARIPACFIACHIAKKKSQSKWAITEILLKNYFFV